MPRLRVCEFAHEPRSSPRHQLRPVGSQEYYDAAMKKPETQAHMRDAAALASTFDPIF